MQPALTYIYMYLLHCIFADGSFHTKKLYSRLSSIKIESYLKIAFSAILWGNVRTPSIRSIYSSLEACGIDFLLFLFVIIELFR